MNYNHTEQFIGTDTPYPKTKLAVRLTPRQDKKKITTLRFGTYNIPIILLRNRVFNQQKKGIMEEDCVEALSYLPNDLVFSWKDPEYWGSLKRPEIGNNSDDTEYKTVSEAFDFETLDENEMFVFSTFNLLEKNQFYDFNLGHWNIRNSDELEDAIDVPCILTHMKEVLFNKDNLLSIQEKRKTVKGTYMGELKITNTAHEGTRYNKNEKKIYADNKGRQDLYFGDLLEWYVAYFDNTIENHGLLEIDNDGQSLNMNEAWKVAYSNCLPKQYREDKRFTILYRRYDPKRETKLEEDYTEKMFFLGHIFRFLGKVEFREAIFKTYEVEDNDGKFKWGTYFVLKHFLRFSPVHFNFEEYLIIIEKIFDEFYKHFKKKKNVLEFEKIREDQKNSLDVLTTTTKYIKNPLEFFIDKVKSFKGNVKIIKNIYNKNILTQTIIKDLKETPYSNLNELEFSIRSSYKIVSSYLLVNYKEELHKLRRKIFSQVIKSGKYKEPITLSVDFNAPSK